MTALCHEETSAVPECQPQCGTSRCRMKQPWQLSACPWVVVISMLLFARIWRFGDSTSLGSNTMNADDMTNCSMIAAYHQMTNARSGRWHHFAGDPLFGRIARGNCQDAVPYHATRERRPHRAIPAILLFDRVLRFFGWRRPN